MDEYIGLDVSLKETAISVRREGERVFDERRKGPHRQPQRRRARRFHKFWFPRV